MTHVNENSRHEQIKNGFQIKEKDGGNCSHKVVGYRGSRCVSAGTVSWRPCACAVIPTEGLSAPSPQISSAPSAPWFF